LRTREKRWMELRLFRAWWSWCVIRFPQVPFQYSLGKRRVVWHRAKSLWAVTSKQRFFSLGLVAATGFLFAYFVWGTGSIQSV